ncbi:hypothetical protein [Amycolatopsis sp. NBC_01286]|uniref:hypothetical protein n=1 Tax=Amycolatopsis sp. NBC_01286 TaxID=2903560 RepID=UPI002E10CD65|nr:hypothetical protein OG570_00125 [Amycolatopsis sp. NBC_01286]
MLELSARRAKESEQKKGQALRASWLLPGFTGHLLIAWLSKPPNNHVKKSEPNFKANWS